MKCPKCGYLGFEEVERCRNCGYEFSLTTAASSVPELRIRPAASEPSPLDDLSLIDAATAPPPEMRMADAAPELNRVNGVTAERRAGSELPLFSPTIPDDEPLITRPSPPRPPLSVRRATPETPRPRQETTRPQALELSLELGEPPSVTPAARASTAEWPDARPERAASASISMRLVAAVIDLAILLAVDVAVVYFTMQICGISLQDAAILPRGPLIAFLLVQNGGYLVAFTAGGQTLGKMVAGIRVVGTESAGALDFGRAFTRTLVWLVLAVPAGLGFLTLFSRDHRGLHDRFAGTRVVR